MSYKTIFSGSAGPFSGILRLRVAELVTLRFFAKRLFSRDLWLGLYSDGFRVARLVVRPLFCRLLCRVACGPAFILSASVSRGSWSGLFFCRLPCRVTRGPAFFPVGFRVAWLVARALCHWALCHWAVVIAGATAFATAALVALFIAGAALWIYNPILTRLIGRK